MMGNNKILMNKQQHVRYHSKAMNSSYPMISMLLNVSHGIGYIFNVDGYINIVLLDKNNFILLYFNDKNWM